jgi:hypothetical protein
MRRALRVAAVVTLLTAALHAPVVAAESPTLVLRIVDYADASSAVLIRAQHHLAGLFGAAGINVAWREHNDDSLASAPGEVTVVLLSDKMAQEKCAKEHIAKNVLGTAVPPVQRAWIFLHRVEDAAGAQGQSAGLVLARVIAHEVAHIIDNVEHSQTGVMAASLRRSDLEGFSPGEAQRLRAALQSHAAVVLDARAERDRREGRDRRERQKASQTPVR